MYFCGQISPCNLKRGWADHFWYQDCSFLPLETHVFWCAPLPAPLWVFTLRVMLLLAVPGHAYMYRTTGKKGLLGAPHDGVSTHHLPENTTVEFSHFVHYTWKISLPPASPLQTGITLCDPVSIQIRHRQAPAFYAKVHELTLLWVLQLQHPLKGLMS